LCCVLYCNILNCIYYIIVISASYWEGGIKGYKILVFCMYINFVISWDICIQLIEFNPLPYSKIEQLYCNTLNCILSVLFSILSVILYFNMLNCIWGKKSLFMVDLSFWRCTWAFQCKYFQCLCLTKFLMCFRCIRL